MSRDGQRSAVYAAQHQWARLVDRAVEHPTVTLAGSTVALPVERNFADIDSIQRYVDAVLQLGWVRQTWPDRATVAVTVRARRGRTRAHYEFDDAVLAIPLGDIGDRWALRELVILHELAHHLGGPADPGHGPGFTDRLLTLLDRVVGPEAAFILRVLLADQSAR